jgi:tetratricopeptide (TPR) repeat protein
VNPSDALQFEKEIDAALEAGDMARAESAAERYRRAADGESMDGEPARAPPFRAPYLAAQVSLAAGRLAEAMERLTPLLAVVGRLPDELAARVRLFLAEALARLRRGAEAWPLLQNVPAPLLAREPLLQLRALRIRLWLGEVAHLKDDLARCAHALESRGDAANLALLFCEEGRAWESSGDLVRAEHCWRQAEESSRPLGNDSHRADVLLQLARLDHLRGRLPAALNHYDQALDGAAPGGPQALEIGLRRVLVLLDVNQVAQAHAEAARLLDSVPNRHYPEEVRPLAALVQELMHGGAPAEATDEQSAYAAAARGDTAAARQLYRRALAATPSPQRQARLALALGLLALAQVDRPEAESWLRCAETLAREHDLPETLWRALQARGQVAMALAGDEALAGRLFEEAVLVSEVQAGQFAHASDAAAYRQQRGNVLRQLLWAACRRGAADAVLRYQELERGRLLLDLWRQAAARADLGAFFDRPDLASLEADLAACEVELGRRVCGPDGNERRRALFRQREELQVQRDRLYLEFLRDRSRRASATLPALPELKEVQETLAAGTLCLAPSLVEGDLYLLAFYRDGPAQVLPAPGSEAEVKCALDSLRSCLTSQLARYSAGLSLGSPARAELDARLDGLGQGPLGRALTDALAACPGSVRRLLWVPDGALHGLPLAAVRLNGRYLIEDFEVTATFSAALLVHQARTRRRARGPFRPALIVTESPGVLPEAAHEGEGVAASFLWHRLLHGHGATRAALRGELVRARAVHFACHAQFDTKHPLAAHIALPSGETLRALEWLNEPVDGLPLVTLSACRSAEVAPLLGREVFGLVTGLLGGGVRTVLAGLWPVADSETWPLMWRFYRHRLTADLATALALAQRESLAAPDASPLFWAAFALFGDPCALPAPSCLTRWLARRHQARHARRFPVR